MVTLFKPIQVAAFAIIAMFCSGSMAFSDIDNSGMMRSEELKVEHKLISNTGKMIGIKTVKLVCDKLTGNGYIKAPIISILAKKFEFTGTIECSNECVIETQHDFNHKMFKQAGGGKFYFRLEGEP